MLIFCIQITENCLGSQLYKQILFCQTIKLVNFFLHLTVAVFEMWLDIQEMSITAAQSTDSNLRILTVQDTRAVLM